MEPDDDTIVVNGTARTIAYAVCSSGEMPAQRFIEEELDEKEHRKLAVLFERLAEHGEIRNREQFKKVAGKIFEFKRHQIRIGCFQEGHVWYLTHGFRKKRDQWPKPEIERANKIRTEHLAR